MSLFTRLRGLAGIGPSTPDPARAVIEDILVPTVPRLRAVSGYARKLEGPTASALRWAEELTGGLAAPVVLTRRRWSEDPLINALFAEPDELAAFVRGNVDIRRSFAETDAGERVFLLTMTRSERQIFGSTMQGGMIRRDVPQTSVTFVEHRALAPCPDEAETRLRLSRLALRFLAERAQERILGNQTRREELEGVKKTLRAKRELLALQARGMDGLFTQQAELARKEGELADIASEVDGELARLHEELGDLEDVLRLVVETLGAAGSWLFAEPVRLRLTRSGIRLSETDPQPEGEEANEIALAELGTQGGLRRAALLVRLPRTELD